MNPGAETREGRIEVQAPSDDEFDLRSVGHQGQECRGDRCEVGVVRRGAAEVADADGVVGYASGCAGGACQLQPSESCPV